MKAFISILTILILTSCTPEIILPVVVEENPCGFKVDPQDVKHDEEFTKVTIIFECNVEGYVMFEGMKYYPDGNNNSITMFTENTSFWAYFVDCPSFAYIVVTSTNGNKQINPANDFKEPDWAVNMSVPL